MLHDPKEESKEETRKSVIKTSIKMSHAQDHLSHEQCQQKLKNMKFLEIGENGRDLKVKLIIL